MKRIFQFFTRPAPHKRRTLLLIWLGWALVMMGYQAYIIGRFNVEFSDKSLFWTELYVYPGYQNNSTYLLDPFLNEHVAWDSEYYLSIAVGGYSTTRMPGT